MAAGDRQYSMVQAPVLSFFSKGFYQDVVWRWRGSNLLYLFLLLAVSGLLVAGKWHWRLSRFVAKTSPEVVKRIPPVHIRQGKLSIEAEEPYVVTLPESDKPLVIVDTTGQYTSLEDVEAQMLATESKLYVRNSPHEIRTYDLSQIQQFDLDGERVAGWLETARRWFFVVAFPLLLIGSYLYHILRALVFGLIGLGFASGTRTRLSYDQTLRLAVIAATPPIVLSTVKTLAGVPVPMWWFIGLGLSVLYVYLGVRWAGEGRPEDEEGEVVEAVPVA